MNYIFIFFILLFISIICNNFKGGSNYKIGILLCCHNRPQYLKQTLESLKKTNLNNCILCIIDDCSEDKEVANLINNFELSNEIIKIRNDTNLGIRYSLLKGFNILYDKCDYLTNIDSDVIFNKDWIDKLKNIDDIYPEYFNNNGTIITGFNCSNKKFNHHKIKKTYPLFHKKDTIGGINMWFNKKIYNDLIKDVLTKGHKNYKWDWEVCDAAHKKNYNILVSNPSVIQHIGINGLSSGYNAYDIADDFIPDK